MSGYFYISWHIAMHLTMYIDICMCCPGFFSDTYDGGIGSSNCDHFIYPIHLTPSLRFRYISATLSLPPPLALRDTAAREGQFWDEYFRFDGAKRPALVDSSGYLRSLTVEDLIPSYSPFSYACLRRGLAFACRHALAPFNNGFLYFSDDKKFPVISREYEQLLEFKSVFHVVYTFWLHVGICMFSIPISLAYYSVYDPMYIWGWWCASCTGYLAPTPKHFSIIVRILASFVYMLLIYRILGLLVHTFVFPSSCPNPPLFFQPTVAVDAAVKKA